MNEDNILFTTKLNDQIAQIQLHAYEHDLCMLLAEECGELAQAASKYYRADSKGVPTPVPIGEAFDSMQEELCDIVLTAAVLGVLPESSTMEEKAHRWIKRIEEADSRSEQAV